MKKKAIALIPLVARRKRRTKAKQGAKVGGPALFAAGAALVALILRKKKKGPDTIEPQQQRDAAPAQAEAAAQDADAQTVDATTGSGAASAGEDTLGSSPVAPAIQTENDDVVVPDTGADDPFVREQTNAAAADAGAIGESSEAFDGREEELGSRRETGG